MAKDLKGTAKEVRKHSPQMLVRGMLTKVKILSPKEIEGMSTNSKLPRDLLS